MSGAPRHRHRDHQRNSISNSQRQRTNKYLGILQVIALRCLTVQANLRDEYLRRLRKIWGKRKIEVWPDKNVRYYFGFLPWDIQALQSLDRETRRILRNNKAHRLDRTVVLAKENGRQSLYENANAVVSSTWLLPMIAKVASYLSSRSVPKQCSEASSSEWKHS